MRTVQVVNVRWYNATAWYGVTLARCLRDAGHESVVAGLPGSPPVLEARKLGLPVLELPFHTQTPWGLTALTGRINAFLKEFQPDVVNCHRGEAFFLWACLKKYHHYKLIRTRGDQRLPHNTSLNRFLHTRVADAVIATNSAMTRHFIQVMGLAPGHVHTILGGVDTARFAPDAEAGLRARAAFGFGPDDLVLGLLGRLDPVKGVAESIRALAAAENPRLRLMVMGFDSRHSEAEVRSWAEAAGVADRVLVTGRVERVQDALNAMDVGLVASLGSEAIARAALEIMACGKPLISSSVGVMPDLLPPEYLFAPGDIAAMAAMFGRCGESSWRESLRLQCAERMRNLDLGAFLRSTLAVYKENV